MQVFVLERGYDYEGSSIMGVYESHDKLVDALHEHLNNDCMYDRNEEITFNPNSDFFNVSLFHLNGKGRYLTGIHSTEFEEAYYVGKHSTEGFNGFSRHFIETLLNKGNTHD